MKKIQKLIFILLIIIIITGCNSKTENLETSSGMICAENSESLKTTEINVEKIEIYHFHGNNQCSSCIAVGALAEETINTYYLKELKSEKIVFNHINFDLPENTELAKKYDVTGSSLWIGVYDENGFHPEQNINVWYKINDKQAYMAYLKEIIDQRLAGNLN